MTKTYTKSGLKIFTSTLLPSGRDNSGARLWCVLGSLLMSISLIGQGVKIKKGVSMRDRQEDHYYKMVNWEDSAYEEFAYWEESEFGAVMEFMNWRAIFPTEYDSTGATKYPMIVMLHGAGESGRKWTGYYDYEPSDPEYDNNGHHLKWGGLEHRNAVDNEDFPGIVIFPQSSYNASWDPDDLRIVSIIIEYMIEQYHASPYRVSVHGLSNGAKGSWNFANYRPDLVASILPMSGTGSDKEPTTDKLVTTPVWVFQGGQDGNPSPGASENWIETLESKGGKPKYTLYPDNGHNTWQDAYSEPDFFSWMLSRDKRNIFVFGDTTGLNIAPNETVDLGFSAGYAGYQWTLDSVAIPEATSRYYTAEEPGTYRVRFKHHDSTAWVTSFPLELEPYSGPPIVYIPDSNFKNLLLSDTTINTNQDGQIQVSEAESYSGQINVNSGGISNLSGIEAFTAITDLRIHYNNLTSVDLSANAALTELHCQGNSLDSLDVSQNSELAKLRCFDNNLEYLNIQNGNNQNFGLFQAANNNLGCIQVDDVTYAENSWTDDVDSTAEFSLQCGETVEEVVNIPDQNFKDELLAITALNTNSDADIQVSEAEAYSGQINVNSSNISSIAGIESFTALTDLRVHNNSITAMDLSQNTELLQLHCQKNNLTSLDISANTKIHKLRCFDNDLTSLNVQNGNNDDFDLFQASDNELTCIQVDDVTYAENNWTDDVDAGVSFSTDCSGSSARMSSAEEPISELPDRQAITIYPNPFQNDLNIRFNEGLLEDQKLKVFDLSTGKLVKQLTPRRGKSEVSVDLSRLSGGSYLIQVGDSHYRVVKEN